MRKKVIANFIGILVIIIISALIEVVWFNFGYLSLPKEAKGLQVLDFNRLELRDMEVSENKIIVKGPNPSIKVKEDVKVLYLKITPNSDSEAFSIFVKNNKDTVYPPQKYEFDSNLKQSSYLRVNNNTNNVSFNIVPFEDLNSIAIKSIVVDNTFNFNLIRFLLIFSILFIGSFFIFYKNIVRKKLHITFLIVILPLGIITSLSTPFNFSFDEKEHFVKAYQVASFDSGINKTQIKWIDEADRFMLYNGHTSSFDTYKEKLEYYKLFSSINYTKKSFIGTTAATYLPTAYIPASIGIFLGKAIKLPFLLVFYLGRIFGVLGYALVLFFSIKKIKVAKRLIFAIGLLPGIVYSASSYSADSLTIAFCISTVVVWVNMLTAQENSLSFKLPIIYAICCSIAVMCKITYAPLCFLILVVPKNKFKDNINHLICKLLAIGMIGIISLITIGYSVHSGINQWNRVGVNPKGQVVFILKNILEYILIIWRFISIHFSSFFVNSIGNFAYSSSLSNMLVYIVLIALFVLAIIDNEEVILRLKKIDKLMLALTVSMSWLLVITALYITFTPVGSVNIEGVQGRYFTPLLVPFLLLFKNNKINNSFNKEKFNYFLSISTALIVVITAMKIFLLYNN